MKEVLPYDTEQTVTFLVWLVLLVLSWPLALLALVLYPIVWLVLLPFRLAGISIDGALEGARVVILLPVRILRLGPVSNGKRKSDCSAVARR